MLIAYDYQIFSSQVYGGISRYFVELIRHLNRRENIEIKIIAPLYINSYARELDNGIVSGVYIPRFPKTARLIKLFSQITSPWSVSRFSPDIVHETYYSYKPLISSEKVKTVITVYDMIHERLSKFFPYGDKTHLIKQQAVKRADHVICISETTKQDLIEILGIDQSKISVVHLGFDLTVTSEETDRRCFSEPYLLYVGDREGYKNFARFLTAYSINQNLYKYYKIICFGGGKFKQTEQQLCKNLGLSPNSVLYFEGSDTTLAQLYRHAAALVYPSLYEGFGIPPLEAMSYGCPVICSSGGSIPEVVGDAGSFFDPYNEDSMAHAIEQVVLSQEYSETLRVLGTQRIARFSWDICAQKTNQVYDSL